MNLKEVLKKHHPADDGLIFDVCDYLDERKRAGVDANVLYKEHLSLLRDLEYEKYYRVLSESILMNFEKLLDKDTRRSYYDSFRKNTDIEYI